MKHRVMPGSEVQEQRQAVMAHDNFGYYADTKEELISLLDYMTTTWANQRIN